MDYGHKFIDTAGCPACLTTNSVNQRNVVCVLMYVCVSVVLCVGATSGLPSTREATGTDDIANGTCTAVKTQTE